METGNRIVAVIGSDYDAPFVEGIKDGLETLSANEGR